MSSPAPAQVEVARMPITSWLQPTTWRTLERFAIENHTTVGEVLSRLADRAVMPKPTSPKPGPRKPWTRMTPERLQLLRDRLDAGQTVAAIAAELGVSDSTVRNHLARAGRNSS